MRRVLVPLLAFLLLYGCKKDPYKNSKAEWTIDKESHQTDTVNYTGGSNNLWAGNPPGSTINIHFSAKPNTNATYAVVSLHQSEPASNECQIGVLGLSYGYDASGKAGDHVDVTVSSGGKLTATFTNISMTVRGVTTDTVLLSGTIIE